MDKPSHRHRWKELESLLDELVELPVDERSQRLRSIEQRDPELHQTIQRLIDAMDDDESFLEHGAQNIGDTALEALAEELRVHTRLMEGADGADEQSDRTLGKYRLIRRLGVGGMGEVWEAERDDEVMRQRVAIKILHPLIGKDAAQRFDRERHILAALQHDGIARILDAGVATGEPPYLVLEYVDGIAVTEFCRDQSSALRERLLLFLQVCDAVAHAHRRLIVHRDLKPSNILVDHRGRVKLLDFGIAKLLDPGELGAQEAVTRVGQIAMTPEYAAPEQIRGEPVTTVTDVYGLGSLLYELLSGSRPFDINGLSHAELQKLICDTQAAPPSSKTDTSKRSANRADIRRDVLRGDLDAIVLKALEKEPDDRYASVTELADDIRNFLDGRPVSAKVSTFGYRTGKFVKRHKLSIGGSLVAATILLAGLTGFFWQAREAELQRARFESTGEFLFTLFEQVDPDLNPGSNLTAVGLLDVGAEQLERLAAGPEARVDLLRVLGVLYSKLGEREQSETLLRQAVTEAQANLPASNNTTGQALSSLGRVLADRGQLEEAERVQSESLASFRTAGDFGRWPLGVAGELARTYSLQGRWREAQTALQQNIDDHQPFLADDPRNLAHRSYVEALILLGELRTDTSDSSAARNNLELAATTARSSLGEDHPLLARSFESLANLMQRNGNMAAAREQFLAALAVNRQAYPNGHQATARISATIALMDIKSGNSEEANDLYRSAVELWATMPEGTHAERADQYAIVADWQLNTGAIDAALTSQQAALFARRLAHESLDHWYVAETLDELSSIQMAAALSADARESLLNARAMRQRLFGENTDSTSSEAGNGH